MQYEVHRVAFDPPTLPTDLGLALSHRKSCTAAHLRSHPSPWPLVRARQAQAQVLLSLSVSLSQIKIDSTQNATTRRDLPRHPKGTSINGIRAGVRG
jgi:hypothetical protein